MSENKAARVRALARVAGITVFESELCEVGDRFDSLLSELEKLNGLDLAGVQPVTVFPEEPYDNG